MQSKSSARAHQLKSFHNGNEDTKNQFEMALLGHLLLISNIS